MDQIQDGIECLVVWQGPVFHDTMLDEQQGPVFHGILKRSKQLLDVMTESIYLEILLWLIEIKVK